MLNLEENLLSINPMSRPGKKLNFVEKIVLHQVSNYGSTAMSNRNYYESLKNQNEIYSSMHYIIGLQGEIIKAVPEDEIAYHIEDKELVNNSIAIENTRPDSTGKLTPETYKSLLTLLVYLTKKYNLNPLTDIVRHYDITGKECPKYYVDNILEFIKLKNDVKSILDKISIKKQVC